MGPQLVLERRSEHAGLDARGARRAVYLEHAVEPREVERDRARVALADVGLDAADDARAPAVRDHRRAGRRGPVEHRPHIVLRAWEGNQVGRVGELPAKRPHDVAERLPVGMRGAVVRSIREDRRGRSQAGPGKPELLEPRRLGDPQLREREARGEQPCDRLLLLGRRPLALPAPAPEPASTLRGHAS